MLIRILRPYRYLGLSVLAYMVIVAAIFIYNDVDASINTSTAYVVYSFWGVLILALVAFLIQAIKLLVGRHDSPTRELLGISKRWVKKDDRGAHAIIGFALFVVMLAIFGTVKSTLPQLVPFSYDEAFYQLDRWLFLGSDPYQLLLPIFGGDIPLLILNTAYQLWMLLLIASMIWILLTLDQTRRLRYLFACLLSFAFAGNLVAVILSSAGPCYFELLYGGEQYKPLFDHLNAVNDRTGTVWALIGQQILWDSYQAKDGLISGISAMPSMHVVFSCLWVLLFWDKRIVRIVAIIYALMILVGSIVLGWHYAVDGIVGLVLALPAWWLSAPLMNMSLKEKSNDAR